MRLALGIARARLADRGLIVEGDDGTGLSAVDDVIVTTGFRPYMVMTRELRLKLDPLTEVFSPCFAT